MLPGLTGDMTTALNVAAVMVVTGIIGCKITGSTIVVVLLTVILVVVAMVAGITVAVALKTGIAIASITDIEVLVVMITVIIFAFTAMLYFLAGFRTRRFEGGKRAFVVDMFIYQVRAGNLLGFAHNIVVMHRI